MYYLAVVNLLSLLMLAKTMLSLCSMPVSNGRLHDALSKCICIRLAFEGQAKPSKIKSVMKWWSKCISVIAKTDSKR